MAVGEVSGDSLHQQYEPEKPIHRAVNITRRRLKDRIETIQHEEYDLWKGKDPVTGRTGEQWWNSPEDAIKFFSHKIWMDTCYVNECMNYLGEGSDPDRLYCDDCRPEEYVECAEDGCEYPTSHTATDHCSSHTWWNGRVSGDSKRTDDPDVASGDAPQGGET